MIHSYWQYEIPNACCAILGHNRNWIRAAFSALGACGIETCQGLMEGLFTEAGGKEESVNTRIVGHEWFRLKP